MDRLLLTTGTNHLVQDEEDRACNTNLARLIEGVDFLLFNHSYFFPRSVVPYDVPVLPDMVIVFEW